MAAEASEAAAAQGKFWEMHDMLLAHQDALTPPDLRRYAEELGLDVERFWDELRRRVHAPRVAEDVASAELSGVSGAPTFFINGRRHWGTHAVSTITIHRSGQGRSDAGEPHGRGPSVGGGALNLGRAVGGTGAAGRAS